MKSWEKKNPKTKPHKKRTSKKKKKKEALRNCILNHQSYMSAQVTPVTLQSCPHVQRAGPQVATPSPSGTSQSMAGLCSMLY